MEIYLFMSKTRTVFGFTSHSDGANLPAAFMPWEEAGSITNHTWLATEVMDAIKGCVANFRGGRDRVVHPRLLYAASE